METTKLNQFNVEPIKVKNIKHVKQLISKLSDLEMCLTYNDPSTPEMIVIENELKSLGIMDELGSYILALPDSLIDYIDEHL